MFFKFDDQMFNANLIFRICYGENKYEDDNSESRFTIIFYNQNGEILWHKNYKERDSLVASIRYISHQLKIK